MIDTHTHLDGEEFAADLPEVMARAKAAGVTKVFLPAIDLKSAEAVLAVSRQYADYAYPMLGLHPEEAREDWTMILDQMHELLSAELADVIAIGEPASPAW